MKTKKQWWIDALIILGMMAVVCILCQPIGRKWDKNQEEMYIGEEGVYSSDTDSYYYLRKAKEFTQNGLSSIDFFSSRTEDPLMTAVQSGAKDKTPVFLSALTAGSWYALHAVGINVGIYSLAIRFCSFLLALCTIPVYLFLRKRVSRVAAVLGALITALAPPYFKHSLCGFYDTDALIGLLALILVLSVLEMVVSKKRVTAMAYGIVAAIAMILLYYTWTVFYVYVIIAIGIAIAGILGRRILFGRIPEKKELSLPFGIMTILLVASVVLKGGNIISSILSLARPTAGTEPWPSAAAYMSELDHLRILDIEQLWDLFMALNFDFMSYFGGFFVVGLLLLSIGFGVRQLLKLRKTAKSDADNRDFETEFLLVSVGVWMLGTLLMIMFGVRFMEFAILPAAIIMAYGFDFIYRMVLSDKRSVAFKRGLYVSLAVAFFAVMVLWKPIPACIVSGVIMVYGFWGSHMKKDVILAGLFMIVVLLAPIQAAYLVSAQTTPYVENTTVQALKWIKENTAKDSVIADFWSLGYGYQYYSERRTIGDGGTYNGEYFYWLGNMFTAEKPELSAGIARMLQNGGIDASVLACEMCDSKVEASDLLKMILPMTKDDAVNYMKSSGKFSEKDISELLALTHPGNCPDIYFVTSYDMVRLSGLLSYYSTWDFTGKTTVEDIQNNTWFGNRQLVVPKDGEEVACDIWKKGYPEGSMVTFLRDGGVITSTIILPSGEGSEAARVVYVKDGEVVLDQRKETLGDYPLDEDQAVIVIEEDGKISFVACNTDMVDSTIMKLYVFGGTNQQVFEKVFESETPEKVSGVSSRFQRSIGTWNTREYTNNGIIIWKIKCN